MKGYAFHLLSTLVPSRGSAFFYYPKDVSTPNMNTDEGKNMSKLRFSTYKHNFIYGNNLLITKQFIVLHNLDGTITFTNFHKYAKNPNRKIKKFNENGNNRFTFINKFLNYAFFTVGINSLSELTVDIGKDFLNAYGMQELPDDDEYVHRNKKTVERCVSVILDFYINLIEDKKSGCKLKKEDLYKTTIKRNKKGKAVPVKEPLFDVNYIASSKPPIYRDIPNDAFILLFDHIATYHKDILGLVMLQAFAGLRPSEACNVRRADALPTSGIRIKEVNGQLLGVTIDLQDELNLRSDFLSVGCIKKERLAKVPDIFLEVFRDTYNIYAEYMDGKPYEEEYSPFSINKYGKAITYDSYYKRFKEIIKEEMIPIYLKSNDPQIVLYGQTLMEYPLSPHVFRHWYTVQLVLSGIENPGVLQKLRGDTSPESALTYINGKGELEKEYSRINNETFNYIKWAAKEKYNERAQRIYTRI